MEPLRSIFAINQKFWRENALYLLIISIPIVAIFAAIGAAISQGQFILMTNPSGKLAANFGLLRIALLFAQIWIAATFMRLIMRAFLLQERADWRIRDVFSRSTLRISALLALLSLGILAFIIVVVAPLLYLAAILQAQIWGARLIMASIALPLFLAWGNFLFRLLLSIPAQISNQDTSLREALRLSEPYEITVLKIELILIIFPTLMALIPAQGTPAIIAIALLKAAFILALSTFAAALYCKIRE